MKKPYPLIALLMVSIAWLFIPPKQSWAAAGLSSPSTPTAIERNSRAFLFVLEFALAAPLTGSQEATIRAELIRGWETRSAEDLKKYDAYPTLVEAIIHATDRVALEDLRKQLEAAVREWLAASDQSDPAVAVIASALQEKGKVLIPGRPALTAMAAAAYSELYAYSELLARVPNALPEQASAKTVAEIRGQLLKAWSGFTPDERGQVAASPGLWVSLRSVLRYGGAAEQAQVRGELLKVAAPRESAAGRAATKTDFAGNMVKHQVMMNISKMTFDHYMYCHGFRSSIF